MINYHISPKQISRVVFGGTKIYDEEVVSTALFFLMGFTTDKSKIPMWNYIDYNTKLNSI